MLEDDRMTRRANKIAIYYLNIDKHWDLDSFLHHKWITPFDFLRAAWYFLSIWSGYADTYRNEQYIPKTDFWYEHEAKLHSINIKQPDQEQVATNLMVALAVELGQLKTYLDDEDQDDNEI